MECGRRDTYSKMKARLPEVVIVAIRWTLARIENIGVERAAGGFSGHRAMLEGK